jgi:hypothetical protein
MDVRYDRARGYPTRLCVDPDARVSDNEFGFVITDFKVLSKGGLRTNGGVQRYSSDRKHQHPRSVASCRKSKYATVVEEACPLEFGHAR